MLRPCSKRFFARQPQERWKGGYSTLHRHCTRLIYSTSKLRRWFAGMLQTATSMPSAAASLSLISLTSLCTVIHTISFCRASGIYGTISRHMTPCTSPSPKRSTLRYSPATSVLPLRLAIMRGLSWCENFGPQLPRFPLQVSRPRAQARTDLPFTFTDPGSYSCLSSFIHSVTIDCSRRRSGRKAVAAAPMCGQ